jgi:ubiquinone biosynthesis monooxygenase Coq7
MTQAFKTPPKAGEADAASQLASMIRVNQAGEYGAKRIYQGQLATLRDPEARKQVQHMLEQEQLHLDYFNDQLTERRVRPTLLHPIWHVGGFVLGAATAALGKEAAMACTVAVESVIDKHYAEQEKQLGKGEQDLKEKISQFRAEEMEHHDTGLKEGATSAPAYPALLRGIQGITRLAITLSKRV